MCIIHITKFFSSYLILYCKEKYYSNTSREVEKGKLSERIGRKVMGPRYCHCEPAESRRSNLMQYHGCQTANFLTE